MFHTYLNVFFLYLYRIQMLEIILNIFYYLFDNYGLTNGIYVNLSNAIPSIQYMWPVNDSNLTFKFTTLSQFQEAYNNMNNIEYISYKTDFISPISDLTNKLNSLSCMASLT